MRVSINDRFDKLAALLSETWAPIGLASCNGIAVPLHSPLATHYSIGGAIQMAFHAIMAPDVAQCLSAALDGLEFRTVLCWEEDEGRTLDDVLRLVEIARLARVNKLVRDLSKRDGNTYGQSFQRAQAALKMLVAAMDYDLVKVAA